VQTPDGAATAPTLLPASAAGLVDVNLPLGDDVLQHNLGVSIVVVCTKVRPAVGAARGQGTADTLRATG
jgi:hypothetical protein